MHCRCPYNEDSIYRALVGRCKATEGLPKYYEVNEPKFYQADVGFVHSKEELMKLGVKIVPCSACEWFTMAVNYFMKVL